MADEGVIRCCVTASQYGIRVDQGEARSVSWLEYQWASLKAWWNDDSDAQMIRGLFNIASFLVPEFWALKAASAASKSLATVKASSQLSDVEYVERLARYLNRGSRTVRAELLVGKEAYTKLGYEGGGLTVGSAFENPTVVMSLTGSPPGRLVVHHELLHYRDLVRNFGGNGYAFNRASEMRLEMHVHWKLINSRRWKSYAPHLQAAQIESGMKQIEIFRQLTNFRIP